MNRVLRRSRWRPMVRASASLLLCLALGVDAQAQNLCATQASQRNPVAVESSGVGGTGAPARGAINTLKGGWRTALGWHGLDGVDSPGGVGGTGAVAGRPGLGGTGISEGGIGGTGIVGVITGFASICVNGVEVHFDASTPLSDNGRPASARELAVGQVVAVRAAGAGAEVSARNIALIHAAVGPMGAINAATGEFRMLGQAARALDPGDLSELKAGDWVRVSGHRLVDGEIAASRIEPIAPQTLVQLNGFVGQIGAATITVEGTLIRFERESLPAGLAPGREVTVSGTWDGSALHAQRVQVDPTRDGLGRVEQVVLEGYVHSLGERQLSLGPGLGPLTLSPDVQMVGGSAAQLAINQRVRVSGRVGTDQRVTVERVEFSNGPSGSDGSSGSRLQRGSRSTSGKGASDRARSPGQSDRSENSGSSRGSGSSDDSDRSGSSDGSGSSSGSGSSGSGSSGSGSSGSGSNGSGSGSDSGKSGDGGRGK